MNQMSTELTCVDLKLTISGLCSLPERKGKKANDNLGKSVIFLTSYKEIWACIPGCNTTTIEDVHEYIRRIMR